MRRILAGALFVIAGTAAAGASQRAVPSPPLTIVGEVRTPGQSVTQQPLTIEAAVARAGGFTADAAVIEIRRHSSGAGAITADTPASQYHTMYVSRADINAQSAPFLAGGDFVIVKARL
ncbi:MAG TPA: SLBB domain-containing protein [Vicinamibacterales bacterium]|nr:SLBB domain-containing protein [Vicinamibacterales bacterium]